MLARSDPPQATLEAGIWSSGTPALNQRRDRARDPAVQTRAVRCPGPAPLLAAIRPWSAGAGGGLAVDAVPASGAVGRVHEGPRRPRALAGSVWPPNSRWARIRTHWNALGPEPRARRATDDTGSAPATSGNGCVSGGLTPPPVSRCCKPATTSSAPRPRDGLFPRRRRASDPKGGC